MNLTEIKTQVLAVPGTSPEWVRSEFGDLRLRETWEAALARCSEFLASAAESAFAVVDTADQLINKVSEAKRYVQSASAYDHTVALTLRATAATQRWATATLTRDNALKAARLTGKILYTATLTLVALGFVAYTFGQWVARQWHETPQPAILPEAAELPQLEPLTESDLATVTLGADKNQLMALPSSELRNLCQYHQIRWRNVHGQGKHLAKAEMVDALLA